MDPLAPPNALGIAIAPGAADARIETPDIPDRRRSSRNTRRARHDRGDEVAEQSQDEEPHRRLRPARARALERGLENNEAALMDLWRLTCVHRIRGGKPSMARNRAYCQTWSSQLGFGRRSARIRNVLRVPARGMVSKIGFAAKIRER